MNKGLKVIDWTSYREPIVEFIKSEEGLIDYKKIHDYVVSLATEKGDTEFLELVNFGKTKRQIRCLKDDGRLDVSVASNKIEKKHLQWGKYDAVVIEMVMSGRYDVSEVSDLHEFYFALRGRADSEGDYAFVKQLTASKLKERVARLVSEGKIIASTASVVGKASQDDGYSNNGQNDEVYTVTDDAKFAGMMVDTNTEAYREHFKKVFLRRNFRNEAGITNLREYVVRTVESKTRKSEAVPTLDLKKFMKKKETGLTLEQVITDIHFNEVSDIPGKEWTSEKAIEDLGKTTTYLIDKNKDGKYSELVIYLPGDNIGTKIHEEITLDIPPLKAAKAIANAVFRMVITLSPHYEVIRITGVGGNHSETRVRGEKPNQFSENYDFAFLEELKSLLSLVGLEDIISYHSEYSDTSTINVKGRNVAVVHGDRSTSMVNLYPKLREDYGISRIDRLYIGHFHLMNYYYDEGILKMFHPCFTNPGLYARNGFGGIVTRDAQNSHEIGADGSIARTFSVSLDDGTLKETPLDVNPYESSSKIFSDTVKIAMKNK